MSQLLYFRGPDWDTEVDGKSCTVKELLIELYEKVRHALYGGKAKEQFKLNTIRD